MGAEGHRNGVFCAHMTGETKRKFIRVDVLQRASIEFQRMHYASCHIKNISLTGMFVTGSFYQQVGDECLVKYSRTWKRCRFSFRVKARLVRAAADGIALEFISMPQECYMELQTALLYEAADPLAIGLELPETCPFALTGDRRAEAEKAVHTDIRCH